MELEFSHLDPEYLRLEYSETRERETESCGSECDPHGKKNNPDPALEEQPGPGHPEKPELAIISIFSFDNFLILIFLGEVAVEQDHLSKLLEAANILQIKGLYESAEVPSDEKISEESSQIPNSQIPNLAEPEIKTRIEPKDSELTGSQKRKKRKSTSSAESLSTSADNNLSKKVSKHLFFNLLT